MIGRTDCIFRAIPHQNIALRLFLVFATVNTAGFDVRAETPPDPIRVGMVRSLCKNVPEPLVKVAMQPFPGLMQAQTGFICELATPCDAMALGGQIAKKEVQLGVFQGFEYAWAKEKYPELRPMLIAVNQHPNRQAHFFVRGEAQVKGLADLGGKELAIPRYSRDHCRMFIEHQCRQCGKGMDEFFSKVKTSMNAEEVLDGVVEDTIQAAVVDDVAWSCYKRRKPGRAEQLKDFLQSEWFPDTVVVYRVNSMDDAMLLRFQEGLLRARENSLGRQLLTLWFMTEFQRVPRDFAKMVKEIGQTYPLPASLDKLTSSHAN